MFNNIKNVTKSESENSTDSRSFKIHMTGFVCRWSSICEWSDWQRYTVNHRAAQVEDIFPENLVLLVPNKAQNSSSERTKVRVNIVYSGYVTTRRRAKQSGCVFLFKYLNTIVSRRMGFRSLITLRWSLFCLRFFLVWHAFLSTKIFVANSFLKNEKPRITNPSLFLHLSRVNGAEVTNHKLIPALSRNFFTNPPQSVLNKKL